MEKCPRAMAMVDRWGRTPCDLLKQIRCLLSEKGATVQEETSSSSSESEGNDWTARMHWEADAEYTESLGAYEQDFTDDRDEPGTAANASGCESYDRWSARMAEEMNRKREHEYERFHPEDAKRSKWDQESKAREKVEFQRKLEREHQEYQNRATANRRKKLTEMKAKYEKCCAEVFGDDNECKETLGYGDVPWPTPSNWDKGTESLKEFLLCDVDVNDVKNVKKYLRGQQVKWHPDRFQQKCGERIKTGEGDHIMDKVKLISQLLNNIIAEMDEG